jgi:hypothetical protein
MPKSVLDTIGITIRRGASPKLFITWVPASNITPKETSLYYLREKDVFNRARDRYHFMPKQGKDNA